MSNSNFEKRFGVRDMTIFSVHFHPVSPTLYFLIDEILLTRPPGHFQSCFLVFYYCHVGEKSEFVYTTSGGWTFCDFVDFELFLKYVRGVRGAFEVSLRCV